MVPDRPSRNQPAPGLTAGNIGIRYLRHRARIFLLSNSVRIHNAYSLFVRLYCGHDARRLDCRMVPALRRDEELPSIGDLPRQSLVQTWPQTRATGGALMG